MKAYAPSDAEAAAPAGSASASDREVRVLIALFAVFLVAGCWALLRRGPWLDEFWSLWQAQHDVSVAEAWRQRWMVDFNPPLFSFVHWAIWPWTESSVQAHRVANLVALGWAAVFSATAIRRFPQRRAFIVVFASIALALPSTLSNLAEARSYFAQICTIYVLTGSAVLIADPHAGVGHDLDRRADRWFAAMLLGSIVVAVNLHYFETLLACLLMGALVILCLARAWRRWAAAISVATLLGLVPVTAHLIAQLPFLVGESGHYWVRGSLGRAVLWFLYLGFEVLAANAVAAFAAAAVVLSSAATWLPAWRGTWPVPLLDEARRRRFAPTVQRLQVASMLVCVLAAFALVMLLAHAHQPIVTRRYLVNFQIVVAGLVACLAADMLARRRSLFVLAIVLAGIAVVLHARKTALEDRWDATLRHVDGLATRCPASPVYAVIVPRATFSANEIAVLRWAYRQQAERRGITLRYHEVGGQPLPLGAGVCPTVLWVEHVDWEIIPRESSTEDLLRVVRLDATRVDLGRAEAFKSDTGFVLSLSSK